VRFISSSKTQGNVSQSFYVSKLAVQFAVAWRH